MNRRIEHILRLTALILLVAGPVLLAEDWPQWRGANRDGKTAAFTVPATWPASATQKWKVTVGKSDSSPALVGSSLFVFARQDTDEVLFCLDASTGAVRWKTNYSANYVVTGPAAQHPGPRSSPVVVDGKVCTLGVGGILSCFDAATGAVLWRKQSTNDYLGVPYKSDSTMSPIVEDGRCIVHVGKATNGAVIAFDLATGEPRWKWDGDGPASSSPVTMTVGGRKQLVTLTGRNLAGIDLASGKLLWQSPFSAAQGNNTTPIVNGQTVIYTGQGKGLFAVKIEQQGDTFAATPLWTNSKYGARFTTPVLKDGMLYGFSGRLFCADAQNGATVWDEAIALGQTAAIVDAGSVIFALGGKGELIAFQPGSKFTQLARYTVADSETWAHPVFSGNRVFVKDNETIACWRIE
jgi:outer membrane protein assembly factor BamB